MPRDFPDMKSLEYAAKCWKFREPKEGESEADFRNALAYFVAPQDFIESQEIRTGKGWDRWNIAENIDMVNRAIKRG